MSSFKSDPAVQTQRSVKPGRLPRSSVALSFVVFELGAGGTPSRDLLFVRCVASPNPQIERTTPTYTHCWRGSTDGDGNRSPSI